MSSQLGFYPMMPSFGFPNMFDSYSNQVYLNDITGMNMFTPPYGLDMGLNNSIFNCNPWSMNMMGMPYMDTFSYNPNSYYQNMDKYYENMMESQIKYQQKTREADIALNAAQKNMRQKGLVLNEKITLNEQEQILPAFKDYVESVRGYYGDQGSEEDLKNTALELYQQQFGNTIQKDIRTNGSDSFWHGFKQVGLLGFGDKITAEENIARITGQPQGKSESFKKSLGNASAGAGLGLISGLALSKVKTLSGAAKKSPKLWVFAAIGTGIGWLYGKILDKLA